MGLLLTDGINTTTNASCSLGDVRLADGKNMMEGRLEVCLNGEWSSVCGDDIKTTDANVVCRQLGYSGFGMSLIITLSQSPSLPSPIFSFLHSHLSSITLCPPSPFLLHPALFLHPPLYPPPAFLLHPPLSSIPLYPPSPSIPFPVCQSFS